MVLHPRESVRRVPPFVSFILHFLADQVAATRHYNCSEILESTEEAPRGDAQASDVRTGIGGWFPRRDENGVIDTMLSPWFSLVIAPEEWPWVFAESRKASLIISALEALAVLVALKLRYGEAPGRSKERVRIAPTLTDNRGTGSAEQTHDDQIPHIGSAHGTRLLHEEDEHPTSCRVDTKRGQQGSGQTREW